MAANPKVTFLIPIRWFNDDREFLSKNLERKLRQCFPNDEEINILRLVQAYTVKLTCHAYKPVEVPLTQKQIQLLLKPVFKNGKCLGIDWEFEQVKSKTVLPVIDFQLFFAIPQQ